MDEDEVVDNYLDVLQNIEAVIVQVDREQPDLTDYEVGDVLDALTQTYRAEAAGRNPPTLRLSPLKRELYDRVKAMCEWRLGRDALQPVDDTQSDALAVSPDVPPISADGIVACLKRLRKSVKRWNAMGGRRGYLEYIQQFLP